MPGQVDRRRYAGLRGSRPIILHDQPLSLSDKAPHDGLSPRSPEHFHKPRLAKGGHHPCEARGAGQGSRWLDGIALNDLRPVGRGVFHGSPQQPEHDSFAPGRLRNEEANDGPDGLVVNPLQCARTLQGGERLSRPYRTPGYGLTMSVGEETRHLAGVNDSLQGLPVPLPYLPGEFRPFQSPPHAPAAAIGAMLPKQGFQIRPAFRGYGLKLQV
jgi:hypothetical protein